MSKQIITNKYISQTNKLSDVEFQGDGKFDFRWDHSHVKNCDFSIFSHMNFKDMSDLEIFGPITLNDMSFMDDINKHRINVLTVWVDRCENLFEAIFHLFNCQTLRLIFWTRATCTIEVPHSVNYVELSKVHCSKLSQLICDSLPVKFETMNFQGYVNLKNVNTKNISFKNCTFINHEIEYNIVTKELLIDSCIFHDESEIKIPKHIKDLIFRSNQRLKLSMIRFQGCELMGFKFYDSNSANEIIIEDFEDLQPIIADRFFGINLKIVSHRIRSISNLTVYGTINSIEFITNNHESLSFADNFQQFSPYYIHISPNEVSIELFKHFQNANFSFYFDEFDDEEIRGQRFEQYLPLMTTMVNHPIRKQLMVLNSARRHDSRHRLKKLPQELIRMVGSFLSIDENVIRDLSDDKFENMIGSLAYFAPRPIRMQDNV